jgi:hypothetical protein
VHPPVVLHGAELAAEVLAVVAAFTGREVPTGDPGPALARLMVEAGLARHDQDKTIAGIQTVYAAQLACDYRPAQAELDCPIRLVRSAQTEPPVTGWHSRAGLAVSTINAGHIELLGQPQDWAPGMAVV